MGNPNHEPDNRFALAAWQMLARHHEIARTLPRTALPHLGNLEARDDAPLDLLAGLTGCFARPKIVPAATIKVRNKSVVLYGC